ncbi:MAG TPA: hypothetical protein VMX97_01925, partial [Hyphomicrobiaceae bacterium]|nr:hypothetical protein [Hyphomicrobiaceae bacterium]
MASTLDTSTRAVYLIGDHLDRILAAGEDLTLLRYAVHDNGQDGNEQSIGRFVHDCRALELAVVAAVLQAREHAAILGGAKNAFSPIARLFANGTTPLLDAVEALVDRDACAFDGEDPIAFLRSRGLIDADRGCLLAVER